MEFNLKVVYIPSEDDWYTAYFPEIPGAVGQGKGKHAALANLQSAIKEIFEIRRDEDVVARRAEL